MSIEDEAATLRNAPQVPFEVNLHNRCHICGQVEAVLVPFDQHVGAAATRYACAACNPNRGAW